MSINFYDLYTLYLDEVAYPFDPAGCFHVYGQGVCLNCGAIHSGIEPDAHHYHCDSCGTNSVAGWEEVLITYHNELTAIAGKLDGEYPKTNSLRSRIK